MEGNLGKGNGVFMLAVDPEGFGWVPRPCGSARRLFGRIKAVPPAPGFEEVPEIEQQEGPPGGWHLQSRPSCSLKTVATESGVDADKVVA